MRHHIVFRTITLVIFAALVCSVTVSQVSPMPAPGDSPTADFSHYQTGSAEMEPAPGLVPLPAPTLSTSAFPAAFRIGKTKWDFAADSDLEEAGSRSFVSRVAHRFGRDQAEIYSAPFRIKNLKWDALVVGVAAPLIVYDETISRSLPRGHEQVELDVSNAAITGTSVTLGALWIRGLKTHDEHAKEMGILELESLANTFTVYTALQLIAARDRPMEAGGVGRFFQHSSVYTSFPGGHSMFTFAMASVVAHEYPKPWVQALAYGAATTVGAMRFTGRQHFASDIVVGSVLGYLIGTHIFHSHCRLGLSSACHSSK